MEQNERYKIINGNSLEVLDTLEENSVDAIITDPPYELGFMGKKWDSTGIAYNIDLWKKAFRVIKSGGYLLAFGGSRTFHRIACAIEDAGFEIRDTIMWLYGSGFPKSMNIGLAIDKKNGVESKVVGEGKSGVSSRAYQSEETTTAGLYDIKEAQNKWKGWGTCLKPAYEPIIVARKPCEGSVVDNVLKYGTGGINIDECRVGTETIKGGTMPDFRDIGQKSKKAIGIDKLSFGQIENAKRKPLDDHIGRFPANVILTYDETDFDEVCGGMPKTKGNGSEANYELSNNDNPSHLYTNIKSGNHYDDEGSACRYFYCAKASKKDRDNGLDMLEEATASEQTGRKPHSLGLEYVDEKGKLHQNPYAGTKSPKKNIHPTVKPCELMQYLVRLVTHRGGVILDIFNGSGSTGKAVAFENRERNADYKYIGVELEKEYCEISKMRIDYAINKYQYDLEKDIKEEEIKTGQLSLFDL